MNLGHTIKKLTVDKSLSNLVNLALLWLDCGHYLENLNKETINLSLYALEIRNVVVKQSALSQMNLPIQVVFGKLEYAKVMAPWTELLAWKDQDRSLSKVEVQIDGLYLLVRPNNQVKYNKAKEEKDEYEAKMAQVKEHEDAQNKPAPGADDKPTFAWGIISKILRNLQITINNIHIRYEDAMAPTPYCLGLSMASLKVETTNDMWEPAVLGPKETKTYKLVTLDSLAVYLNSNPRLFANMIDDPELLLEHFHEEIAEKNNAPSDYMYLLGPIRAEANVILNMNAAIDMPPFSSPILQLDLKITRLFVELSKRQYQHIIHLVECLGVQAKGVAHRHHRPDADSYRGHYRKWWLFAYNCVLEDVRRRRQGWEWEHIKKHVEVKNAYAAFYKAQLQTKKLPKEQQLEMNELEKQLDVLNLLIVREKVRISVGKTAPSASGWFGGLWGGTTTNATTDTEEDAETSEETKTRKTMMNMITDSMKAEEKEKLQKLIQNMEKKATIQYPANYIDVVAAISLELFDINISNDIKELPSVVKIKFKKCLFDFQRRPLADGVRVNLTLTRLSVQGTPDDDYIPSIVSNKCNDTNFLDLFFEMNPLNANCDQRVNIRVHPLRIVFNVITLNELLDVITIPKDGDVYNEEIPALTTETITELRNMTISGLKYVIDKHTIMDINIAIKGPFIIIPQDGDYRINTAACIVIHFGSMAIKSRERKMDAEKVTALHKEGGKKEDILKILHSQIYDRFMFDADDIQILIVRDNEKFLHLVFEPPVPCELHLLNPLQIHTTVETCLISDDPNLPNLRVTGEIPLLFFNVVDDRLLMMLSLLKSVNDRMTKGKVVEEKVIETMSSPIAHMFKLAENNKKKEEVPMKEFKQLTYLNLYFVVKELIVNVASQRTLQEATFDVLRFKVKSTVISLIQKTYNNNTDVCIGSISLKHKLHARWTQLMLTENEGTNNCLFRIQLQQVDSKSPEFAKKYESCETLINVNFGTFKLRLVLENLRDLLGFKDNFMDLVEEKGIITPAEETEAEEPVFHKNNIFESTYVEIVSHTSVKLNFNLKAISLQIIKEDTLSFMSVTKIFAQLVVQQPFTKISAMLGNISVTDQNSETLYRNIIYIEPKETAFDAEITMYNTDVIPAPIDIDVKIRVGKIKICFINRFVKELLAFFDNFQKAEAVIVGASTKAAETAKENINEIYEKALKLKIDISINAPKIAIPEGSKRQCGLALDLGRIDMRNQSITLTIKHKDGHSAVIEEIVLTFKDMKLDMVKFDSDLHETFKTMLMRPQLITILVYRKLTMWYVAVPNLDVKISINDVEFYLGQSDYTTIMYILAVNLKEGGEPEKEKRPEREPKTIQVEKKKSIEVDKIKLHVNTDVPLRINIRWNLVMSSFKIFLYKTTLDESDPRNKSSPCPFYAREGLSEIYMQGLYIRGSILSNECIVNDMTIVNFHIFDRRPGRDGKIVCYMTRRKADKFYDQTERNSENHIMDMTFQKQCNAMFIEIRVCKLMLVLSAEYFVQVAEFFNVKLEDVEEEEGPKSAQPQQQEKEKSESHAIISVNVKCEKPHILFVEDFDTVDTRCLILNFKILMNLRICGSGINLNGNINNIQMYTCMYNPHDRKDTKKMLIDPFNINICGTTNGSAINLEIFVTDIHICIALYAIELIMNILNTLSVNKKEEVEESELKDYSNIWDHRLNSESKFWFLKKSPDKTVDIYEPDVVEVLNEVCTICVESIVITIEAGTGNVTLPMLIVCAKLDVNASEWTRQLKLEAVLGIQMGYYNNVLALWESIIEPVAYPTSKGIRFKPFDISIDITQHNIGKMVYDENDIDMTTSHQTKMMIDIVTRNVLELTVTKTFIETLNKLSNQFAVAGQHKKLVKIEKETPYKIVNATGMSTVIVLANSDFKATDGRNLKEFILQPDQQIYLDLLEEMPNIKDAYLQNKVITVKTRNIHIIIKKIKQKINITISKAQTTTYLLKMSYSLVSRVNVDNGKTVVTLCSKMQIVNDFVADIDVYYTSDKADNLNYIQTLNVGQSLHLPFYAAHSDAGELYFGCNMDLVSIQPFKWRSIKPKTPVDINLVCISDQSANDEIIILRIHGELEPIHTDDNDLNNYFYTISIKPPVKITNYLPVPLTVRVESRHYEVTLQPGEQVPFKNVHPGFTNLSLRFMYLENLWTCGFSSVDKPPEFVIRTFYSYVGPERLPFNLGMHSVEKHGSLVMTLYSPFWMINRTGRLLSYKMSKTLTDDCKAKVLEVDETVRFDILYHPPQVHNALMLSFETDRFYAKKKISVRLETGDWSKDFSIDAAGSSGTINCKKSGVNYRIGVHNKFTYAGFTKKITFTPYMVIINHSPVVIECYDFFSDVPSWKKIPPKRCLGLWPVGEMNQLIKFRVDGTMQSTIPTCITDIRPVLLILNNQYGGIFMDVQATDGSISLNLSLYSEGMAPALIVNDSEEDVVIQEKDHHSEIVVRGGESMLFTWEDPALSRVLTWSILDSGLTEVDLPIDGMGEVPLPGKDPLYWILFLDGLQRVLLISANSDIIMNIKDTVNMDVINTDLAISMNGIGLSLVNNTLRQEILYLSITSSGVAWYGSKDRSKKMRPLRPVQAKLLEDGFKLYNTKLEEEGTGFGAPLDIGGGVNVNYFEMVMLTPNRKFVKRKTAPGIWFQVKNGVHITELHLKINKVQIDNQMYDCVFPVLLHLIEVEEIKPFVQVSIVELMIKNSQVKQYKYFKVLIQEFHLKLELGIVNGITGMMTNLETVETCQSLHNKFLVDYAVTVEPLYNHISMYSLVDQKNYFDYLHISPLKIHFSFSLSCKGIDNVPDYLNILVQSVGATLTDIKDITFKLDFFERQYCFLTQRQLTMEAVSHYGNLLMKQMHVLLFGLDVLGDPYTLMVRLSTGLKNLFYEPYQGAILGPAEFAEGLKRGFMGFAKHAVGGTAGAIARISGAVGTGVSGLAMDDNYRRSRRAHLRNKPQTLKEGLALGGQSLAMGLAAGIKGMKKPLRKKGMDGFFKGLARGTAGLVIRPTIGLMDFTSAVFQSIERTTDKRKEHAKRIRPPRFIQADSPITSYDLNLATGNKYLCEADNSKYVKDIYSKHVYTTRNNDILLFSDQRLLYLSKLDHKHEYKTEWMYEWAELTRKPTVISHGLKLYSVPKKETPCSREDTGRIVPIPNDILAEQIVSLINEHMAIYEASLIKPVIIEDL